MAKAAFKTPRLFVACPYSKKFRFEKFQSFLSRHYPGKLSFAETDLQTKDLLGILKAKIRQNDECIFDVSLWNPNVTLELGLADGLKRPYYIFLNKTLSRDVPSDIKGIRRIEYKSIEGGKGSLASYFSKYILKQKIPVTKRVWEKLKAFDSKKSEKLFTSSVRILCHLRDHQRINLNSAKKLAKGLHLRDEDYDVIFEVLKGLLLVTKGRSTNSGTWKLKKTFFKA